MRYFPLLVALIFSLWTNAQIASVNNSPYQLILKSADTDGSDTSGMLRKITYSGVIYEETKVKYLIQPIVDNLTEDYFFSLVEFYPDGSLQVLLPFPDESREPEDYMIKHGTNFELGPVVYTPPYGNYKTVVILTQNRNLMVSLCHSFTRSRGDGGNEYTKDRIREELNRMLRGVPSVIFKDSYLLTLDYILLPKPAATGALFPNFIPTEYQVDRVRPGPYAPVYRNKIAEFKEPSYDTSCPNRIYSDPGQLFARYPMLTFINPAPSADDFKRGAHMGKSTTNTRYVIQGNVSASKGVREVRINGEAAVLKKLNPVQFFWEKEVTLKPGSNSFTVTAVSEEGAENCDRVDVNYEPETRNVNAIGKNYLLLIGINKYKNWTPLTGAVNDLKEVHKLMLRFGFNEEQITELTDENATQDAIDSAFSSLQSLLGPNDNLLIYYAGHGILDRQLEGRGYWVPVGARKDKRNDFIANEYIKDFIQSFKARHVMVFADACFSGSLIRGSRGEESYTKRVEQLNSRWVFCSGREEVVDDVLAGKKNSPFAYYLIQALQKLAPGQNLSVRELALNVSRNVAESSKQTPVSGPLREAGDEGGEFVFERRK